MGETRQPDFTGWATKYNVECTDGRTIKPGAFAHMDGKTVPLVWQHDHGEPENVLGHAELQDRAFGVFTKAYFNETARGQHMKEAVKHGDVASLSIYADKLNERRVGQTKNKEVFHGMIRELSLVLAGANPGALIDNLSIRHADGKYEMIDEEAIVYTDSKLYHSVDEALAEESTEEGEKQVEQKEAASEEQTNDEGLLQHADDFVKKTFEAMSEEKQGVVVHMMAIAAEGGSVTDAETTQATEGGRTAADVVNDMTEDEKKVTYLLVEAASPEGDGSDNSDDTNTDKSLKQGDEIDAENSLEHNNHQEGTEMANVFDQTKTDEKRSEKTLSHSEQADLLRRVREGRGSLKHSVLHADAGVLQHADYGVEDIEMLFPDYKTLSGTPGFIQRKIEWVEKVNNGVNKVPFARVKTIFADITADEARAKGYIKGTQKKDEVIKLLQRTTGPATIYKKQKLDRDDILDITSFDIVAWLKAEIRMMLLEEVARAILVGDGRAVGNPDKIKDPEGAVDGTGIRSIAHDHDLYAIKVDLAANVSNEELIEEITRSFVEYRGTGTPTFFTTHALLVELLLLKDKVGRRLYETVPALAAALGVNEIVTVPVMAGETNLLGIIVNLVDYTVGTNAGGQLTFFSDFDIDFNQEKYLLETRMSGGLTVPYSAIVLRRDEGTEAVPTAPSFNSTTNTITIPVKTGVIYTIDGEAVSGSIVIDEDTTVQAKGASGYYIPAGSTKSWSYTYTA